MADEALTVAFDEGMLGIYQRALEDPFTELGRPLFHTKRNEVRQRGSVAGAVSTSPSPSMRRPLEGPKR